MGKKNKRPAPPPAAPQRRQVRVSSIIPINKILEIINPAVRFVIGRRDTKGFPHRHHGKVKVYTDREQCWKDGRAQLPKHLDIDVFGLDQENWDRFKKDVPNVEIGPDGKAIEVPETAEDAPSAGAVHSAEDQPA